VVPKVFSQRTLAEFEAASASIPLRPLDRAFEGAKIRLGKDPGGPDGARRIQFRRYIASVNQNDPGQLERLGAALGALIEEVATSKQDFLVKAAERDGFAFANGVFRAAATAPSSFAVTRVEDLASIDDCGRRLQLLANDNPTDAIAGAKELVESVCRLKSLELVLSDVNDSKKGAAVIRTCLEQLGAIVASLRECKGLSPRHARLAVGAAVTIAHFVAETYAERTASKN
jgi:hypothetical protein